MSSLEERRKIYNQSSINMGERELRKLRIETKDYFCKYEYELLDLVNKIPNWETYLTPKQCKIVSTYINVRNTTAVDIQLNLTNGVSWHTLFGSVKKDVSGEGGVYKKLKKVYEKLQYIESKKGITEK